MSNGKWAVPWMHWKSLEHDSTQFQHGKMLSFITYRPIEPGRALSGGGKHVQYTGSGGQQDVPGCPSRSISAFVKQARD